MVARDEYEELCEPGSKRAVSNSERGWGGSPRSHPSSPTKAVYCMNLLTHMF